MPDPAGPEPEDAAATPEAGAPEPAEPAPLPQRFRRHWYWCFVGGVCPLIPVPYVDEWALAQVRKLLYRRILESHDCHPTDTQIALLVEHPERRRLGCFWLALSLPIRLFRMLLWYPVKRLLRKILFVFTIRDCAAASAQLLHQAFLLDHAIERGLIEGSAPTLKRNAQVLRVSLALHQTLKENDPSPVKRLLFAPFRESKKLLVAAGRELHQALRQGRKEKRPPEDRLPDNLASGDTKDLLEQLGRRIWHEQGYWHKLRDRFDAVLDRLDRAGKL